MEVQPNVTTEFNLFFYCPALKALWEKHITDAEGYLKSPEQVGDIGFSVVINYDPKHPDTALTDCVAPIKAKGARHPGAPYVEFIETIVTPSKLANRYKVKCEGCILLRGGFATTTRQYG